MKNLLNKVEFKVFPSYNNNNRFRRKFAEKLFSASLIDANSTFLLIKSALNYELNVLSDDLTRLLIKLIVNICKNNFSPSRAFTQFVTGRATVISCFSLKRFIDFSLRCSHDQM